LIFKFMGSSSRIIHKCKALLLGRLE
jgi:hypothetical protein